MALGAPSMMTNSVQPCDICGDIGFTEFIATCFKCHKSREHIYCMRFTLKGVPKSWYCEACRCFNSNNHRASVDGAKENCRGDAHESSKRQLASATGKLSSGIPQNVSSMEAYASKARDSHFSKPLKHFFSRKFEKANTGRVKCIPVEAACKLISGAKPNPSSLQDAPSSNMGCLGTKFSDCNFTSLAVAASLKASTKKGNSYESSGLIKSQVVGPVKTNTVEKQNVEVYQPLIGKSPSCLIDRSSTSENSEIATGKLDTILSKDYMSSEKPGGDIVLCEEVLPNPPAMNASWEGCFEIFDFPDELYVEAYPAGKISPKAYAFSRQMPEVLPLKLQPQHDLWPETFGTGAPIELDIALYFWAGNFCRSMETYNRLLELMEKQGLCMESRLNGVELLVFTSKQLPVEFQRINKQFYLWGVFHSSKGRHTSVDCEVKPLAVDFSLLNCGLDDHTVTITHKVDDQVTDLETETDRDREVGTIDESSRSNSMASCWDNSLCETHSHQPIENGVVARHLHEVKKEQCDDYEVLSGVSRFERSIVVRLYQMRGEECDDYDAPFSRFERSIVARYLYKIKKEQYDDYDAPPGFSQQPLGNFTDVSDLHQTEIQQHDDDDDVPPGFPRPIASIAGDEVGSLDIEGLRDFGGRVVSLRRNSMAGDNFLVALSRADSQQVVKCTVVSDPHQTEIEQYDDDDFPPGFSNSNSLEFSRPVTNMSGGGVGSIDMDVGPMDMCLRRNSMFACWDNSLNAIRGNSHQPVEKGNAPKELHQMRIDQYDDYDAPPGFRSSNALGFSRPVTSMAGGGGPFVTSLADTRPFTYPVYAPGFPFVTSPADIRHFAAYAPGFPFVTSPEDIQPFAYSAHAPGSRLATSTTDISPSAYAANASHFSNLTNQKERDPSPKESTPLLSTAEPSPSNASVLPNQLTRSSDGLNPEEQSDVLFCKICNVSCVNVFSFKQHLAGRRHAERKGGPPRDASVLPNELPQSFNGLKSLFCEICKVPCPGEISFRQHVTGKRHAARFQAIATAKISGNDSEREQDGKPETERYSLRNHRWHLLFDNGQHEKIHRRFHDDFPFEAPRERSRFQTRRVGRQFRMFQHDGSESDMMERTPSPTRSWRDWRTRSPSPMRWMRERRTRSPSPMRSRRYRKSRTPSPLRSRWDRKPRTSSPMGFRRYRNSRTPSPLRSRRDRQARRPSQMRSRREAKTRTPSSMSPRCDQDQMFQDQVQDASPFETPLELELKEKTEEKESNEAKPCLDTTDSLLLTRKRPRFREKKREERIGAMGDENKILLELDEDKPSPAKRRPRFREKKIDQECKENNATESRNSSCLDQPESENSSEEGEWKIDLFHE